MLRSKAIIVGPVWVVGEGWPYGHGALEPRLAIEPLTLGPPSQVRAVAEHTGAISFDAMEQVESDYHEGRCSFESIINNTSSKTRHCCAW